jgi:hypothetical protein
MEKYAIITPTRDRPIMMAQCKRMVRKFTIQPEKHYIIDYNPIADGVDISERIQLGVEMAKSDGIDLVFIIEDDDYYPSEYISRFMHTENHDFFGVENSIYYNLNNRTWQYFYHDGRSSLYCTGFRISSLDNFQWPVNTPFVDIELWKHATKHNLRKKMILNSGAIGMKGHLEGSSGGKGHRLKMNLKDSEMKWLQNNVTPEAYGFYAKLPL